MSYLASAVSESINLPSYHECAPGRRVASSSSGSSSSSHPSHLESFHLPSSPPPESDKSLPVIQHSSSPPPPPPTEDSSLTSSLLTRIRYFLDNDYHLGTKSLVLTITSSELRSFIQELQSPSVLTGEQVRNFRSVCLSVCPPACATSNT